MQKTENAEAMTDMSKTSPVSASNSPVARKVGGMLLHIALMAGALVMALPFVWMLLASVKDYSQVFQLPPTWIPDPFTLSNFVRAWETLPFGTGYVNSLYIAFVVVGLQLLTCSMAAYAFARIEFPLRGMLFILFLATLMIPQQVTIIPLYLIMREVGWIDSHLAIIVPNALFNAFGVFLLRQFIRGIPRELEEAAIVDGANRWTIYWRIILPLIKPALAAFGIFAFLFQWNNFFQPLVFLDSPEKYTVPLALNMTRGMYATDWTLMMAGSAIAVVPVLIVYLIGQRHIIEGIALTGIKR